MTASAAARGERGPVTISYYMEEMFQRRLAGGEMTDLSMASFWVACFYFDARIYESIDDFF